VPKEDVELPTDATDECDDAVTVTTDAPDVVAVGPPVVTAPATEASGTESTCSFNVTVEGPFIRGEANQTAKRDIADALCILDFLFGKADALCKNLVRECLDASDVNDDGTVNQADPIWLLSYLFTSGPLPPAPFPDCGADPTDDILDCKSFAPCAQ
jgi:hypothetical protein